MHTEHDTLVVDPDAKLSEKRGDKKPKLKISEHVDPDRIVKLNAALGGKGPKSIRAAPKKKQKRHRRMPRAPPPDAGAFTVEAFCMQHMLSHSMYYKLKADGLGPREFRLGIKVLISREAAAEWRAQREA